MQQCWAQPPLLGQTNIRIPILVMVRLLLIMSLEGESSEFIRGNATVWGTGKFKGHKYFILGSAAKGPDFKIPVVESHYSLTWLGEQFDGGDLLYEAKILYDQKIETDLSNIQDTIVLIYIGKKMINYIGLLKI